MKFSALASLALAIAVCTPIMFAKVGPASAAVLCPTWNAPVGGIEPFDHMVARLDCESIGQPPVDIEALKQIAKERDEAAAKALANTPWRHEALPAIKIATFVASFNTLEPKLLTTTITGESRAALNLLVHQGFVDSDLKPAALNLCGWLDQHGYARLVLPPQCPIP